MYNFSYYTHFMQYMSSIYHTYIYVYVEKKKKNLYGNFYIIIWKWSQIKKDFFFGNFILYTNTHKKKLYEILNLLVEYFQEFFNRKGIPICSKTYVNIFPMRHNNFQFSLFNKYYTHETYVKLVLKTNSKRKNAYKYLNCELRFKSLFNLNKL